MNGPAQPTRRSLLRLSLAGLAATLCPTRLLAAPSTVRIGLTPVILDDQLAFLGEWRHHLERGLQRPVEFVQRGSYREIIDLTLQDKIQFAWLCGFPYVRHQKRLRLLAVPVYTGQPLYQAYLIVPSADTQTHSLTDLRDRVFAYSDPDSNSGFLFPNHWLSSHGHRPESHFRRSFFTYSHRHVIEAVASRLAHGGSVDGYVWDTLLRSHPELVLRTRIIERSPPFGFPPLVAAPGTPANLFRLVQEVLLTMQDSGRGRHLLDRLALDRFETGTPALFAGIAQMAGIRGASGA